VEEELLMRPRVPLLEKAVIFGLREEKSLTVFRMLIEGMK
jgi:hypothetical protein